MAFVTKECKCIRNAPLAQLDRAFGYGPKGRGFESLKARHVGAKFALLRLVFLSATENKPSTRSLVPPFHKSHAGLTCSVVNALTTARCRYRLFASSRAFNSRLCNAENIFYMWLRHAEASVVSLASAFLLSQSAHRGPFFSTLSPAIAVVPWAHCRAAFFHHEKTPF